MAYGKVMFGNKAVEMKATAATPPLFKRIFSFDLLKTLAKLQGFDELGEEEQIDSGLDATELISKLGFIMAMQAEKADFSKMNIENYYSWLDEFDVNSINPAEIMNIYLGNTQTTVDEKKEDAAPSEN